MSRSDRILVGLLWGVAALGVLSQDWSTGMDLWEWGAALREAARDPLHPAHPLLKADGHLSSRFTPQVIAAGCLCKATGLAPLTWLVIQGLAVALLLPWGIIVFCRRRWPEPDQGRYAVLAAFFLWGLGWQWSGELAWITVSQTWNYPVTLGFTLMVWALAAGTRWLAGEGGRWGVRAWLGLLAAVTTHPETGAVASLLMVLLCVEPWRPGKVLPVVLGVLAAWALAFAWPWYSLKGTIFHGVEPGWIDRNSNFYNWHLMNLGPGLLGLAAAFRFARDRKEPFLVASVVCLSGVYALAGLQHGELGRMLFHLIFVLHLCAARQLRAWGVLDPGLLRKRVLRGQVFHVGMAFLVAWAFAAGWHLKKASAGPVAILTGRQARPQDRYAFLAGKIGPEDVVAADPETGWPLAALTGARAVALFHVHPLQRDQAARAVALKAFLDPATSDEARSEIAGTYGITAVLLRDGIDPPTGRFGEVVAAGGGLSLVRRTPRP